MRGVGVVGALADAPAAVVSVAALLTHLGHPVALLGVAVALFWHNPERGGRLLGVTLTALAAVAALKAWFAAPRPPPSLWAVPADYYAFPSGHATGAAAVYGGVAALFLHSIRARLAAGAVVAVVAASRVVLGVHYLVDVVAGVLTGAATLLAGLALSRRRVTPAFWLAAFTGVAALALAGTADAAARAGAAVAATVAWTALDPAGARGRRSSGGTAARVAAALAALSVVAVTAWALDAVLVAAAGAGAVGGAGSVAAPSLVARVRRQEPGRGTGGVR